MSMCYRVYAPRRTSITGNNGGIVNTPSGSSATLIQQAAAVSQPPPEGNLKAATERRERERNPSMSESVAGVGMHQNLSGSNLQGLMALQWRGTAAAYDPLFVMPYGGLPSARYSGGGFSSPPGPVAMGAILPAHPNSMMVPFQARCGSFSESYPGGQQQQQQQPGPLPLVDSMGYPVGEGSLGELQFLAGIDGQMLNSERQRIGVLGAFNSFDEVETYAFRILSMVVPYNRVDLCNTFKYSQQFSRITSRHVHLQAF